MRALHLVAALCAAGCFAPKYKSGDLRCEPVTRRCPDGYSCAADNTCWKNGSGPMLDLAGSIGSTDLGGLPPESDCFDGIDNNGDGQIDCDDPTCAEVATCVPDPGAGNELGVMNASGCSATGYTTAEPQHQELSQPSCTGCTCASSIICTEHLRFYYTDKTCTDINNYDEYQIDSDSTTHQCVPLTSPKTYAAYYQAGQQLKSSSCSPKGTAMLADSSWGISTNFCAAPRYSHNNCGGDTSKVCSPKPPASTGLCTRIPGNTNGCPSGYGTGLSGTYYSGYTKGSCSACGGCNLLSSSCTASNDYNFFDDRSCGGSGSTWLILTGSTSGCDSDPGILPHTIGSVIADHNNQSISCSSATVTTNPSTPTGASLICCQ